MKYYFLLLAIVMMSCNNHDKSETTDNDSSPVKFDGLYSSDVRINENTGDKSISYLKFYEDGTVISISANGTPEQINKWFKKDHESVSKGSYTINGDAINFSTTYKEIQVEYSGKIMNSETLQLHSKSLSNNNEADITYSFVQE
jgi:hypothetical protein